MIITGDTIYSQPEGSRWTVYVSAYREPSDPREVLAINDAPDAVLFATPPGQAHDDAVLAYIAALGLTPQDVVPVSYRSGVRPGPFGHATDWRAVDRLGTSSRRGPSIAEIRDALNDLGIAPDDWYGSHDPTEQIEARLNRLIAQSGGAQ